MSWVWAWTEGGGRGLRRKKGRSDLSSCVLCSAGGCVSGSEKRNCEKSPPGFEGWRNTAVLREVGF
jgi:hypothetical protein